MNQFLGISLKLGLICAVAALLLGLVNAVTAPRIEIIREERLLKALAEVAGGGNIGEFREVAEHQVVQGSYDLSLGGRQAYILRLMGKGYGGDMTILASYDAQGEVLASKMMENSETPGLGKEAEKPEYMEIFLGRGNDPDIPLRKNQLPSADADGISGATVTFSGVAAALHAGSDFVKGGLE